MRHARAMADLASHSELVGNHLFIFSDSQRSGGVASEAGQDARGRIESSEHDALLVVLPRRDRVGVKRSIPRKSVFAIGLAIDSSDKCDRLQTGAEGPIAV